MSRVVARCRIEVRKGVRSTSTSPSSVVERVEIAGLRRRHSRSLQDTLENLNSGREAELDMVETLWGTVRTCEDLTWERWPNSRFQSRADDDDQEGCVEWLNGGFGEFCAGNGRWSMHGCRYG